MAISRATNSFVLETRVPARLPPPHSCDTQFHAYGDPSVYPLHSSRPHEPQIEATFEEALKLHRTLGIERGVFVQPTGYQTDHRFLIDCLLQNPNYRGTALVDDTVTDEELARLDAVGVKGARFNFTQSGSARRDLSTFMRNATRVAELGWHIKIRTERDDILDFEDVFRKLKMPALIDHMGHLDYGRGVSQPAFRLIHELLKNNDNWWIMLGNADRYTDPPWDDSVPVAQAYIEAAPDRVIWATDWPHNQYKKAVPNDADLLDLQLYRYAPDDATLERILVDNPARLYGFS